MHRYLAVFALVGLACTMTPVSVPRSERQPRYAVAERPAFDTVTLSGLSYRAERVSSRTAGSAQGSALSSGQAFAQMLGTRGSATYSGSAQGYSRAYGTYENRTYEFYENKEWREVLRVAIENARVARRIVDDAPVLIEALEWNENRTGAVRLTYDFLLSLPTLGLFPWLGSTESTVELRVYLYGELIRIFVGKGRVNWSQMGFWANGNHKAGVLAKQIAITDAVGQMAAEAPEIAAVVNPGRTASGTSANLWCSRWSDPTRQSQCKLDQSQAYRRLEPAIERLKWDKSSAEAKALRQCYSEAKFSYGTDWVAVENCTRSQTVPASRYR